MREKTKIKVKDIEKPERPPRTIEPRDNVRVETTNRGGDPTIDAMNEIANGVSDWLHQDLKAIIRPLQVLPEIPKHFYKLKTLIVNQFSRLFTNQMAAEMKSREANIRVANEKTKFVEEHIEKKKEQLEESKRRVQARFESHAESISEDHESELERLDSHAYKIIDDIYPKEIQEKFSYQSSIFWDALAEHSSNAAAARSVCLEESNDEAASSVSSFLDEREKFYEELRKITTRGSEEGVHQIPFWLVEVEDTETGGRKVEVIFPWDLYDADPPLNQEQLKSLREAARSNADHTSSNLLSEQEREEVAKLLAEEQDTPDSEIERFRGDDPELYTG